MSYLPVFELLSSLLAELDVLLSFAYVSSTSAIQYTRPILYEMGSNIINLKNGRHPCVEVQNNLTFIANDYCLNNESKFIIITGPNMGGKSTYIRAVGFIFYFLLYLKIIIIFKNKKRINNINGTNRMFYSL